MGYTDKNIHAIFLGTTYGKSTHALIIVREFDEKERNKKMLRVGGKFFLAAIFSIFIPILHFILVPGFIIGGIIAVNFVGSAIQIQSCQAECPECNKDFGMVQGKPVFPKEDYCSSCRRKVIITVQA